MLTEMTAWTTEKESLGIFWFSPEMSPQHINLPSAPYGLEDHDLQSRLCWWIRWWRIRLQFRSLRFDPWVGKIPWRRKWQPTPALLPGESHGQRNLAGYSPWGCRVRYDWVANTDWLTFRALNIALRSLEPPKRVKSDNMWPILCLQFRYKWMITKGVKVQTLLLN